jgi:DNA polymerase-3 subunit chi
VIEHLFYHLEHKALEDVLPGLLNTCLERDWRSVICADDPATLVALSPLLWSFKDNSFLAHGIEGDLDIGPFKSDQPIWLSCRQENPNGAHVLFRIGTAEAEINEDFQRFVYLFDGHDDAAVASARGQWTRLKEADLSPTYWQQSIEGKWEKRG